MNKLFQAARNLIAHCFALDTSDHLVFVSDGLKGALAQALAEVCGQSDISYYHRALDQEQSYEPPQDVAELLNVATAALISTRRSYTHTNAVRRARETGLRVATSSGISEAQLSAGLAADYTTIAQNAERYAARLEAASYAHVKSSLGTDLSLTLKNQRGFAETGLYTRPGNVGNLPAGEASCGIDEDSANGVLIVDGSYPGVGIISEPITFEIKAGQVTTVIGKQAAAVETLLNEAGEKARHLAELGIGLNPAFQLTGNTLLDEKVAGTLHLGFGNNVSFGGNNDAPYHADAVIKDARLYLDDVAQPITG